MDNQPEPTQEQEAPPAEPLTFGEAMEKAINSMRILAKQFQMPMRPLTLTERVYYGVTGAMYDITIVLLVVPFAVLHGIRAAVQQLRNIGEQYHD
jgi:hypothetical protein